MSPQEKAKKLINKFTYASIYFTDGADGAIKSAKSSAKICVDEIIGSYDELQYFDKSLWKPINEYWQQVKSEISKL